MKQLIIASHANFADGVNVGIDLISNISNLTAEALAAYSMDDGTPVDSGLSIDPAAPFTGNEVVFGVGSTPGTILSNPIDRVTAMFNKYIYTAPASKVMAFGTSAVAVSNVLNNIAFGALVVGDTYGFSITDLTKPFENITRYRQYEHTVQVGDTQTTILTALVNQINADPLRPANAATVLVGGVAVGVTFTAVTAGKDFSFRPMFKIIGTAPVVETQMVNANPTSAIVNNLYYDGGTATTLAAIYGSATVDGLVPNNSGTGTSAQLAELERDWSVSRGNLNAEYMLNELWTEPSKVVPGTTYTTYVIKWQTPTNHPGHEDDSFEQELIIAVPSGNAAVIAAIDLILANL